MQGEKLSIVVPTLQAAAFLEPTLECLPLREASTELEVEVIVVDGGSEDATEEIARAAGADFIVTERGRGRQLRYGALTATGSWLLFLHADTRLGPRWLQEVERFIAAPDSRENVGVFHLAFDDPHPGARRIERLARWRSRVLGLPYGDQGLLISRDVYENLGGYKPIDLMEDVDLIRRISRRRIRHFETAAVTSARRYRQGGWLLRPLRNLVLLGLFYLGCPSRLLHRLYG